mgnify:CR=1 FL=1
MAAVSLLSVGHYLYECDAVCIYISKTKGVKNMNEKMNYEDFKNELVDVVKEELADRGHNVNVQINTVEKMNESYEAMTVTPEGSNIGMNINITALGKAHENGTGFDEIVDRTVDMVENHLGNMPQIDVDTLTDYEQMKDKLAMEVVSAERNAELLSKVPHQEMEDMAVVYRFVLESGENGRATILITDTILDKMGVTPEQLHADALENAPEIRPAVIKGMSEVMMDMMGPEAAEMFGVDAFPENELMYVATVPDKMSGAGVIAYQEFMDQAAEKLGGDFFILPSSVHEILLVKDDGNADHRDLKAMVEEVNATQVAPEEKLTDNVYHYDSKEHVFELAEKFEARQQAKEKEADISSEKEEKGSVLGELKAKKDEVAKQPKKEVVERVAKSKGGEAL